jgi:hypothetical protein
MSRPGAGKKDITCTDRWGHHFSHDVRFETCVHQAHGDSGHHEAFAAYAVADDALGGEEFLTEYFQLGRFEFGENGLKVLGSSRKSA